jgi:LuxR family maltose regulon positive regulatory protein
VAEVRQADLCFTVDEAADFLSRTMGLKVSFDNTARVTAHTEGWIAGLQMAALSMQNVGDVSGFVAAFTGRHSSVFDYLMEEILARQTPEMRRFLLDTSILDQLTAPLCDALVKDDPARVSRPSAAMLEELERANLFIIRLDHERRWYRYHTLFAELLRGYLQRNEADRLARLHARASAWFEAQALVPDAIHHALAAGDGERVVKLSSANVFALLEQNELSTVSRRLESLGDTQGQARSWLWISRAWLAAYTGRLASAETLLATAESDSENFSQPEDQQALRGHCAAIRAFTAWISGCHAEAAQMAEAALAQLADSDAMTRCLTATVLGLTLRDPELRQRAYERALLYAERIGASHLAFFAYGCWVYDLVLRGRLSEALEFIGASLRLAQPAHMHQTLPSLSYLYTTLALILWQRNQLREALEAARKGVALARRWQQADALHFAYTILGDTLFALGQVGEAFDILHQARQLAQPTSPWFQDITLSQEIEWYLAQNNIAAAVQRLAEAHIDVETDAEQSVSLLVSLAVARVSLAQGKYDRALAVIAATLKGLQATKNVYHAVRFQAYQARAYHGSGDRARALAVLEKALALTAPEGYVRHFLEPGEALIPLLKDLRKAGKHPSYIDRLLTAFEQKGQRVLPEFQLDLRLAEVLSAREMEVLHLLAQGCSDKRIAESLVIARETVHKHLKNIYGKLNVHSRTEAVACARELGLL